MSLSEKSRSALYLGLRNIVDEEALQEMLSHFPARDLDEPVTNDGLRASMADLRAELKGDMAALEQRLIDRMNRMQRWNIVTMIALAAVVVAAIRI